MNHFWAYWLVAIAATFLVAEIYAIKKGKPTLSQFIWRTSKAHLWFPWVAGFITGALVIHFWVHWCP